jgi:plastocyanin
LRYVLIEVNDLKLVVWALPIVAAYSVAAIATDSEFVLAIEAHRFQPEALTVPVGKKIRLTVENHDASAEEFESFALNREKVIAGNSKTYIFIGPLDPGRYPFVGEFHTETAHGVIVAQ